MPKILKRISYWLAIIGCMLIPVLTFAQQDVELKPGKAENKGRIKGEKPNQLDILKVDVLQLGINELRVSYEMQTGKHSSVEFGLGAIYKNAFWYDRGDYPLLANGGGLYLAYRFYMDKKKYFSEPKLRSYFSPMIFYRYSSFKNEWIAIKNEHALFDCYLQSQKIHQVAAIVRFGWQTNAGRLALDFYTGLGFKFMPTDRHVSVVSPLRPPLLPTCTVINTTTTVNLDTRTFGTNVIFNAGVKLGLRRNNKERHYQSDDLPQEPGPDPESPPQF